MFQSFRWRLPSLALLLALLLAAGTAAADTYQVNYAVRVDPAQGEAEVAISLEGKRLPSRLTLHIDPERHSDFRSEQKLEVDDDTVTWHPAGKQSRLSYRFAIENRKGKDSYDAMITDDWAVFRSDALIPPVAVKAAKGLESEAVLDFDLPDGWSSAAPYDNFDKAGNRFRITDPGRSFVRPKGWLILGHIASRQDIISDIDVRIAAPRGQGLRLQDTLAFIGWTLPHLRKIFPDFPPRMLIVTADDPMWRGGLSAPNSQFMHLDRPHISGNRTSSLVHEMVHIGTSIHGTDRSDWIVEGIAEFYAVEILHRSGAISEQRFLETLDELAAWGEESPGLFTGDSSGATTAKAVGVMYAVDQEIREKTSGEASLDDVATALAKDGGTVSVKDFIDTAEQVAGGSLEALQTIRQQLDED
ncbi:hypothetical protein [Parahaliea aestuarii]|uniref:Peptidase M61 catalytic domain-containing protein n=1 Tax=Parahaliea aestuarii TaxID=1852021 RepID=A0A5C8ZSQ3_9GAMM|nr:hypothetical protein [Parahaliea aestuarii]TXS91553.1 hypothetical protein FVW59_10305 [Parahaliea aestuarii]